MPWSEYAVSASGHIAATWLALMLPLGALLAGCASQSLRPGADNPAQVANSINLSGFPSEYKRGFTAGCVSSRNASGFRGPRRTKSALFTQGWRDGVDYCQARKPR